MSLGPLMIGLINAVIVVVVLLLVGAFAQLVLKALGWPPDDTIVKLYLALVALIFLGTIVALLFGLPTIKVIGANNPPFWLAA
jgi:hypothetical protein